MRVLVVDDQEDLAELLSQNLEMAGAEVVKVTSDFDGLFDVEAWDGVDVAVVDVMLPYVDGRDLLEWMERHVPRVRRVAWTAMGVDLLGDVHAHAVLQKPSPLEDIISAVHG